MPTYEYECTKCEKVFELYQSITASTKKFLKTDCEQCNNKAPVVRLIGTGAGVIFKGSGFFQTDYRTDSYKKGAKAEKDAREPKSDKDKKTTDKPAKKKESKTKDAGKSDSK